MKLKNTLGMAIALGMSTLFLSGCDGEDKAATAADQADIDSQARTALAKEDSELKDELKKAQEKDPTIKDMYYGTNEQGEKELHIVRETKDPQTGASTMTSSIMPFVTGMLLGNMMSNMFNQPNYGRGMYPSRSYSPSEYRNRRNAATSAYVARTRSNVAKTYVSSRPTSAYSTRATGALSGGSSARAGGYSAGG